MKIDMFIIKTEKYPEDTLTLPKEIFEVKFNADLVHQIAVSLSANERQISAHTKITGEKSAGGGKKPWRQKGTGRARVGSIAFTNMEGRRNYSRTQS